LFPGFDHGRIDVAQVNCEHSCIPYIKLESP